MKPLVLLRTVAILLCCAPTTLSCDNPLNVEEIDRATNAGREVPAPICPDESSSSAPSQTAQNSTNKIFSQVLDNLVPIPTTSPQSSIAATATPTSTPTSSPDGYGNNTVSKDNTCVIFVPRDDEASQYMCRNICGDAVAKQVEAGKTGSVTCSSWIPKGQTNPVNEKVGGATTYPGKCTCNEPFIDELADTFVDALPKIAEIAVHVFVEAFELAFEAGALAIPGVGEAVGPGIAGSIAAARLADWTYDATDAAKAFTTWAQGAGKLPNDMNKVFGVFNKPENESFLPGGKFTAPKGVAKGSGKPGDKGDPDAAKTADKDDSSVDQAAKNDSEKENKDSKDNKSCKKQKRGGDDDNCSDKPASSHEQSATSDAKTATSGDGTITSTIVKESSAESITIPVTCSALEYGQACYNYYSAIKNNKDFNNFRCTDQHKGVRDGLTAVKKWKQEHNYGTGWKAYTTANYVFQGAKKADEGRLPKCDVDEFPPAYFRDTNTLGQVVRYLPSSPNRAAGSLWTKWCNDNDGGLGNGQFLKNGKDLNENLVTKVRNLDEHTEKGKGNGDSDTVYETWSVKYQRAIFSMTFDWKAGDLGGEPNEGNSWGLQINPCWPKAILPGDPGWVLDVDDDWYKNHVPSPDLREQYGGAPSQDLIDKANAWLQDNQDFKIGGDGGGPKRQNSHDGQGANKAQKVGGTSNNSRRRKRSLHVSRHGLLGIRDDKFNTTRLLTGEELSNNIEVTNCADRTCSKERRALEQAGGGDDESVLVIRGQGPQMTPPADVEAVPTDTSILPRKEAARLVRSIERNLPMATDRIKDQTHLRQGLLN